MRFAVPRGLTTTNSKAPARARSFALRIVRKPAESRKVRRRRSNTTRLGRGNVEDAGERIFDAADSRQVELAARAQKQSAPLLLDGKLKAICRRHGRLNSPAPLQSGDQGRRGRKDPRARAALHATLPAPCPKPGSSSSPAKSTNPEPGAAVVAEFNPPSWPSPALA